MLHEVWGGSDACQGTRHKVECGPCCRRCDGPSIFCIRSMQSITHLFPRSVPPSLLFLFVPEASSASAGPLDLSTIRGIYRVFSKHYVFFLKFCDFLNSASSAAALVFYLPGVCLHTLTPREKEKGMSPEYFKIFKKNTIFIEYPVFKKTFPSLPYILRTSTPAA